MNLDPAIKSCFILIFVEKRSKILPEEGNMTLWNIQCVIGFWSWKSKVIVRLIENRKNDVCNNIGYGHPRKILTFQMEVAWQKIKTWNSFGKISYFIKALLSFLVFSNISSDIR